MEFFKANIIPGEVFVQIIAFLIVFWVLKLYAWKPILKALDARRQRIRDEFDRIETLKKEIDQLKAEYAEHLRKIDEEARVKIQQAVEEGRKVAREIQEKARIESQANFEKAKDNIELEIAKARISLRREVADLSLRVSEKIIREQMDDAKLEKKVLELIEELDKT